MKQISEVIPFWNELTETQKIVLEKETKWMNFKKGSYVIGTADGCLGALFITAGQLRTYIVSDEGREITMYRLREGDTCVLSASCVMEEIAFDVSMKAMEHTQVLLIPSNILESLLRENAKVELFFAKLTNERFSEVMWTMQQILFFGADKRVAIFLWDEMAKSGCDTIKFTHEEIAVIIGSAREVVSRILKMFEEEEIVILGRGSIKIIHKEKLRAIC